MYPFELSAHLSTYSCFSLELYVTLCVLLIHFIAYAAYSPQLATPLPVSRAKSSMPGQQRARRDHQLKRFKALSTLTFFRTPIHRQNEVSSSRIVDQATSNLVAQWSRR